MIFVLVPEELPGWYIKASNCVCLVIDQEHVILAMGYMKVGTDPNNQSGDSFVNICLFKD